MFRSILRKHIRTEIRKTTIGFKSISSKSFENGIYKSDYEDVELPNQDICSMLFPKWEKWNKYVAVECLDSGEKLNYGELLDASLKWGNFLTNMNLNKKVDEVKFWNKLTRVPPRVAIYSPNVLEYIPVLFGTLAAGFSLTTISSSYKIGEIKHNLRDTKPEALVVHPSVENYAIEALRQLEMTIPILSIGPSSVGNPNLRDILQDRNSPGDVLPNRMEPSDVALILHSGGTTGLPKGVALPHSSVTNNLVIFTDPRVYCYGPQTEFQHETVMGLMPFYHSYGLYVITITNLFMGSKILVQKNFDPNTFGEIIHKHQIKFLHLVPTLMNFIVNSPSITGNHLKSLEGALIAAANVLPSVARQFKEKVSKDIVFQEGFGMTEILGSHLTPKTSAKIGFCGQLLPNAKAQIVDLETNEPLGPGEKGELVVKCPSMMSHYLNNPKATYEAVNDDGWLKTGDVAVATEDGYFSIVDRLKDLIKVKGFQVSPAEIEDVLMTHPAVAEAAVVGIPGDKVGERPRAYISLNSSVCVQELANLVESNLASYKRLTGGVVILDRLPKSQAGKILRKDLKTLALKNIDPLK